MIVVDIETSGIYAEEHGVWQIGAVDLSNPHNEFFGEARLDDEDLIMEDALKITGVSEYELRHPAKQSQEALLQKFFKWAEEINVRVIICQNTMDYQFLRVKAKKYGLMIPFHYRILDLHTLASVRYYQLNGDFFLKEGGYSGMGLRKILEFCGIPDDRRELDGGEIAHEGESHNALKDAKLSAECFCRLTYGESLFPKFGIYKIPEDLVRIY